MLTYKEHCRLRALDAELLPQLPLAGQGRGERRPYGQAMLHQLLWLQPHAQATCPCLCTQLTVSVTHVSLSC